jgi:transposase
MPRGPELGIELRKLIIKLTCEGKSLRQIGEIIGKPHSTVQKVLNKYKYEGTLQNLPGRGRKKKLNDNDERMVLRRIRNDPKLSVPKLQPDVESVSGKSVCCETIRNVLHRYGFYGRMARKKPFISEVNRKKRIEFAKMHLNKDQHFWNSVIWSDESKFNIFTSDGGQRVWRKPNTALQIENIVPTVKHGGGSVFVWGCMAAKGVGNLAFIDGIMDRWVYLDILKKNLKKSARKLKMPAVYRFQQDNDPKHTAGVVKQWLLDKIPQQLKTPPQSPDLNPIEHLWSILKSHISKHHITSKDQLKAVLQEEWLKINPETTKKLVNSMRRRLQAVIDAKGYPTAY